MDDTRFDDWARRLVGRGASRRGAWRLLAGAALAGLVGQNGAEEAAAACVPAGQRCGGGGECCRDATCRGGRCRCKRGEVACFAGQWGRHGRDNGEFDWPVGVAVGPGGRLYVTDFGNKRIQKFAADGAFLLKWGRWGEDPDEFWGPHDVAVAANGRVYVADPQNHRIKAFAADGAFLFEWRGDDSGGAFFEYAHAVAVHDDGAGQVSVYVTDSLSHCVQQFDADGRFLAMWGKNGCDPFRPGSGDGEFHDPTGVAVDGDGHVYVAEWGNDRVQKFAADGTFLAKWGEPGSGAGQFDGPQGVAVDGDGHVYVAEWGNARVQKFAGDGAFLGAWGRRGRGHGEFRRPSGVAVGKNGRVYVADKDNNRIQEFLLA